MRRPSVGSSRRTLVLSPSSTSLPGSRSSAGPAAVAASPPSCRAEGWGSRLLMAGSFPGPSGSAAVLASLTPDVAVRNVPADGRSGRVGGDMARRDRAEPAGLEVGERVHDLLPRVHDERPVHGDR